MSKTSHRNAATLTARLSALMLVAGALAPAAFAQDAKPAQATEQATEQAQDADKDKTQAQDQAATQAAKPAPAPATAAPKKPANPCAPAPRKKKARNPCA
ncbi:MAG: hypothetical protein K0M64_10740 [Rhizobium sp.]|nr:hypothetical protein [Rhizobium sp.]